MSANIHSSIFMVFCLVVILWQMLAFTNQCASPVQIPALSLHRIATRSPNCTKLDSCIKRRRQRGCSFLLLSHALRFNTATGVCSPAECGDPSVQHLLNTDCFQWSSACVCGLLMKHAALQEMPASLPLLTCLSELSAVSALKCRYARGQFCQRWFGIFRV